MRFFIFVLILGVAAPSLLRAEELQLSSPAFQEGETIPEVHTCDGKNSSPALRWTKPPLGTQTLVIVMEDPKTAKGLKTHWLLYNLPPSINSFPEAIPIRGELAFGELQGTNDNQITGYSGPCPPAGETHPYTFRLYALDTVLRLKTGISRTELQDAMEGHILSSAELTATYSRKK